MSEPTPPQFDLTGKAVGDEFLGCRACGAQYDAPVAMRPECPECGKTMNLYTVRDEDLMEEITFRHPLIEGQLAP